MSKPFVHNLFARTYVKTPYAPGAGRVFVAVTRPGTPGAKIMCSDNPTWQALTMGLAMVAIGSKDGVTDLTDAEFERFQAGCVCLDQVAQIEIAGDEDAYELREV